MWWPVVSISRRWRPWWITPLRRIFKRISIVWGAPHAPGRPGGKWKNVGQADVISMPQHLGYQLGEGWRFANGKVQHFLLQNIWTSHLLFPSFAFIVLDCFCGSVPFHMHHFCYHIAGGAYIYLRDTWWFGPFWEDASWERWLLGAYQTLRQSIQESDLESLGSRINLRHCHHLFLKKPLQNWGKFPIPKEARSRKKSWWTPALKALDRCLG